MMKNNIVLKPVQTAEDFSAARALILEYVKWLGIDMSFQNFETEMNTISETYSSPNGGLFIALVNNKPVGVAGIKRFNDKECEVKRMYVQPESRGLGIGKMLLNHCIKLAKDLKYEKIKLDTAGFMKSAIRIYLECGFSEIPSYRHNPYEEAKFFELTLK